LTIRAGLIYQSNEPSQDIKMIIAEIKEITAQEIIIASEEDKTISEEVRVARAIKSRFLKSLRNRRPAPLRQSFAEARPG
jgi:hypothetical protein